MVKGLTSYKRGPGSILLQYLKKLIGLTLDVNIQKNETKYEWSYFSIGIDSILIR